MAYVDGRPAFGSALTCELCRSLGVGLTAGPDHLQVWPGKGDGRIPPHLHGRLSTGEREGRREERERQTHREREGERGRDMI